MTFEQMTLDYRENNGKSVDNVMTKTHELFKNKYSMGKSEYPAEKFNGSLIPGKIYMFNYFTDSKVSKINPFINKTPVAIHCGNGEKLKNGSRIEFFIDLIVTPHINRYQILERIYETYEETIKINEENLRGSQIPLDLRPNKLKRLLAGTGYTESYTGFKREFFRDIEVIDYSDWISIPYVNFSNVNGLEIGEIYKKYQTKLKSNSGV